MYYIATITHTTIRYIHGSIVYALKLFFFGTIILPLILCYF